MENSFLYLFLHLPKTGGAMFLSNAESSLPHLEFLRMNHTHGQSYFDRRTQKMRFYEKEGDFEEMLAALSAEQKGQIRLMGGHDLYYGIHQNFLQTPRYFAFFREPVARTISLYNYRRGSYLFHFERSKKLDRWGQILFDKLKKVFLIDGKIPSFEQWLEESYNEKYLFYYTMTRSLQQLQFLDLEIKADSWDRLLQKFYFVGLMDTVNEDVLYLHHEIGMRRFGADQNASYPYISYSKLDRRIQERIREKNADDFVLYEHAKQANADFKKNRKNFPLIVRGMEIRKKRGLILEKGIHDIKRILRPIRNGLREIFSRQTYC